MTPLDHNHIVHLALHPDGEMIKFWMMVDKGIGQIWGDILKVKEHGLLYTFFLSSLAGMQMSCMELEQLSWTMRQPWNGDHGGVKQGWNLF